MRKQILFVLDCQKQLRRQLTGHFICSICVEEVESDVANGGLSYHIVHIQQGMGRFSVANSSSKGVHHTYVEVEENAKRNCAYFLAFRISLT